MVTRFPFSSTLTHLPLRERVRKCLQLERQYNRPGPDMAKVHRAVHLRANAVRYQQQHYPAWFDLPQEMRDCFRYPASGHGMATINTMLGLFRAAEEAEAELRAGPVAVSEDEVEREIRAYLQSRGETYTPPKS